MNSLARAPECEICANDSRLTPMEFAFRSMSIPTEEQVRMSLMSLVGPKGCTWFSHGWEAGMKSTANPMPNTCSINSNSVGAFDSVRAWTVGYLAACYASDNGYATPNCIHSDPADHAVTPLEWFVHNVECAGRFPTNSLRDNPFAMGILEACMEACMNANTEVSPRQGVEVIASAIDAHVICIARPPFDTNPTVSEAGRWSLEGYIEKLDNEILGWWWYDLRRAASGVQTAAMKRRLAIRDVDWLDPEVAFGTEKSM